MLQQVFCGVTVTSGPPEVAAEVIIESVATEATAFRFVNSGTFHAAAANPTYWSILADEGVNLCDGAPLAWVLRRRHPFFKQARGPAVFEEVLKRGQTTSIKHFFLGTTDETLKRLTLAVNSRFPETIIAGSLAPPFGKLSAADELAIANDIVNSGANLVWVALGTPKQDLLAHRITVSSDVTSAAVGAAFDFLAGTKRTAPPWMQRVYLEWAFRLCSEPRRLWKRYLIGNYRFLGLVIRDWRGGRRNP